MLNAIPFEFLHLFDFIFEFLAKIGADGFTNVYAYLNWIRDVTGIKLPKC